MIYIEQPDGSGHQFTLTDPRQATDPTDPNSIGAGQNPAKVARYDLGYRRRFCYALEHKHEAVLAAALWDGADGTDPPGPWIKEKSKPPAAYDRLNPRMAEEDFV